MSYIKDKITGRKIKISCITIFDENFLGDGVSLDEFDSIKDLTTRYTDYEPSEPLIKDEKIRKAVRAWAEAQGLTEVYCASNGYEIYGGVDDWVMQFKGEPFPFADKNRLYTIDELCGEEKE